MTGTRNRKETGQRKGEGRARVYEMLRRDILSLKLEPGTFLDEGMLSESFGVSRTPMREAIIRLGAEGLVRLRKNSQARVAPMDTDNLREHHEAIEVIHRVLGRWAATRRSDSELDEIEARQAQFETLTNEADWQEVLQSNVDFHLAIGAAAHNHYMQEQYARLLNEGQRYARISLVGRLFTDAERAETWRAVIADHRAIINALRARDPDAADKLSQQHAKHSKARLLRFLSISGADEIPLSS